MSMNEGFKRGQAISLASDYVLWTAGELDIQSDYFFRTFLILYDLLSSTENSKDDNGERARKGQAWNIAMREYKCQEDPHDTPELNVDVLRDLYEKIEPTTRTLQHIGIDALRISIK